MINAAYQTWSQVWHGLFSEKSEIEFLNSDGFTRIDEALVIFSRTQCVAFLGVRTIDLNYLHTHDDSLVQLWPEALKKKILKAGGRALIMERLAVHPKFRLRVGSLPTMPFLGYIMIEKFKELGLPYYIGLGRKEVGVAKFGVRHGGEVIEQDIVYRSCLCDLVLFEQSKVVSCPYPKYAEIFKDIYSKQDFFRKFFGQNSLCEPEREVPNEFI